MSRFRPAEPRAAKTPEVKTNIRGTIRVMVALVNDEGRIGIQKGNIVRTMHVADATVTDVADYIKAHLFNR